MTHIVVAMSGGVDSSVAAALLHEQGHRVIGVTLRLIRQHTGFGCCGSTRDIEDARAVCARLGVPHYVMDFSDTFQDNIIDPFVRSYLGGETPNPCISCNRFVKFNALLNKAVALGADAVATGHYARMKTFKENGRPVFRLFRAADPRKDQSYVLHHLGQQELSRLVFPVGEMLKAEVREAARRFGLRTADKPDSQEICFVPGADTSAYLKNRFQEMADERDKTGRIPFTAQPGPIRDTSGRTLGTHRGVAFYTHGQREGLGISAGKPLYVVDLDADTNTVVVGSDQETLSENFFVRDVRWTQDIPPASAFEAKVQIRSRHEAAPCRVSLEGDKVHVRLLVPQRAVTPGQSAVFYRDEEVLGGGTIIKNLEPQKNSSGSTGTAALHP
jgi:tRNA-specific 2-thiouridylase